MFIVWDDKVGANDHNEESEAKFRIADVMAQSIYFMHH